uniref:Uncharacterized protein n=1 Tax=Cacopsylla melanoneura TaxID=428564 RepID=A0A8D8XSB2_9HEMI
MITSSSLFTLVCMFSFLSRVSSLYFLITSWTLECSSSDIDSCSSVISFSVGSSILVALDILKEVLVIDSICTFSWTSNFSAGNDSCALVDIFPSGSFSSSMGCSNTSLLSSGFKSSSFFFSSGMSPGNSSSCLVTAKYSQESNLSSLTSDDSSRVVFSPSAPFLDSSSLCEEMFSFLPDISSLHFSSTSDSNTVLLLIVASILASPTFDSAAKTEHSCSSVTAPASFAVSISLFFMLSNATSSSSCLFMSFFVQHAKLSPSLILFEIDISDDSLLCSLRSTPSTFPFWSLSKSNTSPVGTLVFSSHTSSVLSSSFPSDFSSKRMSSVFFDSKRFSLLVFASIIASSKVSVGTKKPCSPITRISTILSSISGISRGSLTSCSPKSSLISFEVGVWYEVGVRDSFSSTVSFSHSFVSN